MVLFVGDVASDARDREAFQEVDFASFFGPSTKGMAKRVERIDDARRIPEYVARAFATAMNGRPGPVVLVLPEDMLTQTVEARPLARVEALVQAWSDPRSLAQAARAAVAVGRAADGAGRWWRLDAAGRRRPCSDLPKPGTCRCATPSVSRTVLTTATPCTPATWAWASTRPWPQRIKASDVLIAAGPAPGRVHHGRLHPDRGTRSGSAAGAHPRRSRRAGPRLPAHAGHLRHHERGRPQPRGAQPAATAHGSRLSGPRCPTCPGSPGPTPARPTTRPTSIRPMAA